MRYYAEKIETVLEEIKSTEEGLSSSVAEKRLTENGPNQLKKAKKKNGFVRFLEQFKDPMILILLVAAVISAVTSVMQHEFPSDVIIIMTVVLINAILGVVQESKAEKAIEALQKMSEATTKVKRNGEFVELPSSELVVGDIIQLSAGDAVPADARCIECASLKVEEAALTGESVPVEKEKWKIEVENDKEVPLGDRKNMVYMGSSVSYGSGVAVVTGTGMDTEMGKIAGVLAEAKDSQTPLQLKLAQLSKILSFAVLGICIFMFGFDLIRHYVTVGSFNFDFLLNSFMIAVSLAVAAIPEGLVAVVTIVLSLGVTNMSKRNAIIRKLTAVETLGCAEVICSDKTGTLTQNKMTVLESYTDDEELLAQGMTACSSVTENKEGELLGEPTEVGLAEYGLSVLKCSKKELDEKIYKLLSAPFDSGRKMMSTFHTFDKEGWNTNYIQFTKGAPDVVLGNCTKILKNGEIREITEEDRKKILAENKRMADKALRVLACSFRLHEIDDKELLEFKPKDIEKDLVFLGLTGMMDPVRPEVKGAIDKCREAGIKPVMITGDHKDTAVAIGKELGIIDSEEEAITGAELDEMTEEELEKKVSEYSVYGRVQPEHKVRIVNAWKQRGKVTAMTGDGVNDAPSIKSADIGVGMGITGTDVTKNVADMVLADDNFATIVSAVEEGRRIYANIRKAIQFLLASNLSEVITIFVASLMGFTILQPAHLLWINLVTDCFPALALSMEKGEPDVMKKPPRKSTDGIFSGGVGYDCAYQGVLVSALTIFAYFIGHFFESGTWGIANSATGMTMAFLTMSMCEIFHSLNMRSQRESIFAMAFQGNHNKFLLGSTLFSLLMTTAVVYIPGLNTAFGFAGISFFQYAVSLLLAFAIVPAVEIVKAGQRKWRGKEK